MKINIESHNIPDIRRFMTMFAYVVASDTSHLSAVSASGHARVQYFQNLVYVTCPNIAELSHPSGNFSLKLPGS